LFSTFRARLSRIRECRGLKRAAVRRPEKWARKHFLPEKPMAKRVCTDRLLE
jgi:hypothetical protein